jgi:hypothetical protein
VTAEDFIKGVHVQVYRAAIDSTLRQLAKPIGSRADRVELSAWFNGLTAEDKERVAGVVRSAVYSAVFDMMAVLDGVKVIDNNQTELYLRTGSGALLNEDHDLHELFQISVDHELGYVDEFGRPLN